MTSFHCCKEAVAFPMQPPSAVEGEEAGKNCYHDCYYYYY